MRAHEAKLRAVCRYRKGLVVSGVFGTILIAAAILRVVPKTYCSRAVIDYAGIRRAEQRSRSSTADGSSENAPRVQQSRFSVFHSL